MDLEREVAELTKRVAALEAAAMTAQPALTPSPPLMATPGPVFLPAIPPIPAVAPATTMPPPPTPGPAAVPQPGPPPPTPAQSLTAAQNYPPPAGPATAPTPRPPASFEWGIETLLRWAGVVLVSLAGIFLVSTAISRGWIGPELQLLGAALGGGALLAAAVRLSPSRQPWALALGCGGAVVLAASALATHEWLDLVGPGVALGLLIAATAASIATALKVRLEGIAVVAGFVGLVAPLETLDNFNNFNDAATLTWIAAFIVGSSALGLAKMWPGMRLLIGWIGAALLVAYAVIEDVEGALQALGFVGAIIVAATLWAGPTIAHRLAPVDGPGSWGSFNWLAIDYRLVAFVPAWTWAVAAGLLSPIDDQTIGLVAIGTAAGFLAIAAVTWQQLQRLVSVSTILGSLGLLAMGFAIWLDGPALMVALAGQAVTSYYVGRQLDDKLVRYGGYLVGLLASALAASEMFDAIDNERFATAGSGLATLLVVCCWVGAAAFLHRNETLDRTFGDNQLNAQAPFVGAWAGTMMWLAAALIGVPQGLVLISVAWAIMACVGLVLGLMDRNSMIRNVAMGTLGITLFKLVTIDMAEVDVFWRVGLFFVVGMGLIALGLKVPALLGPAPDRPQSENPHQPTTF